MWAEGEGSMRKAFLIASVAAVLAACGQSNDASKQAVPPDQPKKKPPHCFFKDAETKGWRASRDKDGNIVVKGKAYRSDSRYKAVLNPATITGTTAELTPTIVQNDTGYGAEGDWWEVTAKIPNSVAVEDVKVTCGPKTFAELKVALKG
jgi:hypothetical protein